jgi:hypothetical protein
MRKNLPRMPKGDLIIAEKNWELIRQNAQRKALNGKEEVGLKLEKEVGLRTIAVRHKKPCILILTILLLKRHIGIMKDLMEELD